MNLIDDTGIGRLIGKIKRALDTKVDKVSGKGLSTNDYTTTEKTKLSSIAEGAEVNVQADWNATDTTSDAYIKNKPAIPTVGNGAITIKQAGTPKGTFTMNQSGNTTIELTDSDTNTWRGIQNNLTSDSTTDSLAAKQGKILKAEIDDLKNSVSDGKTLVANAITGKGVTTATDAAFQTIANNIDKIATLTAGTADATASASNILSGKTAYVNGSKVSGTMPNQGAKTAALNCSGSYTIPAGYHNGSGKVTANNLASQITPTAVYDKYKHTDKVLATCPVDLTSANCHYNGNDAIYLIGGNNPRQTTRYNIKDNTYTTLPNASQDIRWNSSVLLGNQIICFGDSNVLTFMIASNSWHKGIIIPESSKGGSVALVDDTMIFGSTNSNYSKYVTKYTHTTDLSGGSFTTVCTNQPLCSNRDTGVRYNNPGTSDGVHVFNQTVNRLSRPNYSGYTNSTTLPGNIYGGVVAIPNRGYFLCAVQHTNQNILWDGISGTLTTLSASQHYFYTAALCAVGDDVYIFGSGKTEHNKKASVFHTGQFFKTHY